MLESAILGGWLVGREVGQPELVVTKTIYAKVEFWTVRLVMSFENKLWLSKATLDLQL